MRIQTRLFLGTAALVLSLMGLQWWIYTRQLRSIEDEMTRVATSVGVNILTAEREFFGDGAGAGVDGVWVEDPRPDHPDAHPLGSNPSDREADSGITVVAGEADGDAPEHDGKTVVRRETLRPVGEAGNQAIEWVVETNEIGATDDKVVTTRVKHVGPVATLPENVRKLVVAVEDGEGRHDRFLVVSEDEKNLHRIPIPVSPAVSRVQETMREGAVVGGMLLMAGLFASAVLSRRLTRPLRTLADGAEALGRGELGLQVPETATGEVGDLERAFNRMSARLSELEAERDRWQEREHLAQLGDLSRGLAHTLRNPLHTLGLAVEELAEGGSGRPDLVATSRAQIRRIDRWLRSFLALGAEEIAEPELADLGELVRAVALESVQQGASVAVEGDDGDLWVRVVPGAVRAALANLVENAIEVSPVEDPVAISIVNEGDVAVVCVVDRGPGLPEEVRKRLFSPHVTTKVGGSGMGLFLARQLVVGMLGGALEIADRPGGGTVATIRLPVQIERERDGD
jgi:signal transduction histidine kinase